MFLFVRNDFFCSYKWRSRNTCRLLIFNCPNRCASQMKRSMRTSYDRANIHTNHLPKAFETTDHHQSSHLWLNSFFVFYPKKNKQPTSYFICGTHGSHLLLSTHFCFTLFVSIISVDLSNIHFVYLLDSVQKATHEQQEQKQLQQQNVHALVWQ